MQFTQPYRPKFGEPAVPSRNGIRPSMDVEMDGSCTLRDLLPLIFCPPADGPAGAEQEKRETELFNHSDADHFFRVQKLRLPVHTTIQTAVHSCTDKKAGTSDNPLVLVYTYATGDLILSIDVGVNNLAIWVGKIDTRDVVDDTTVAQSFETVFWDCVNVPTVLGLDWPNVNKESIGNCADAISNYLKEQFPEDLGTGRGTGTEIWTTETGGASASPVLSDIRYLLVEQQPMNPRTSAHMAVRNLKMMTCAHVIRRTLGSLCPDAIFAWVSPQRKIKLVPVLDPEMGAKTKGMKTSVAYGIHKKESVKCVENTLAVIPRRKGQKKDDYSDSILQALAYFYLTGLIQIEEERKATNRVARAVKAALKKARGGLGTLRLRKAMALEATPSKATGSKGASRRGRQAQRKRKWASSFSVVLDRKKRKKGGGSEIGGNRCGGKGSEISETPALARELVVELRDPEVGEEEAETTTRAVYSEEISVAIEAADAEETEEIAEEDKVRVSVPHLPIEVVMIDEELEDWLPGTKRIKGIEEDCALRNGDNKALAQTTETPEESKGSEEETIVDLTL